MLEEFSLSLVSRATFPRLLLRFRGEVDLAGSPKRNRGLPASAKQRAIVTPKFGNVALTMVNRYREGGSYTWLDRHLYTCIYVYLENPE